MITLRDLSLAFWCGIFSLLVALVVDIRPNAGWFLWIALTLWCCVHVRFEEYKAKIAELEEKLNPTPEDD